MSWALVTAISEQLNAYSEELNATMCHNDTDLVSFTLGSHPFFSFFEQLIVVFSVRFMAYS
jgi:hypothetical protein